MTAFGGDRDLVRLPHGWRAQEVPVDAPPVDLFAVGPGTEGDRAPSVVVTHADGADGSLREWAEREVMGPDGVLATVRVLDSATLTVSGLPAVMHLSTLTLEGRNLTQMHVAVDEGEAVARGTGRDEATGGAPGAGPTSRRSSLVLTCPTRDFAALSRVFEQVALSFSPMGGGLDD